MRIELMRNLFALLLLFGLPFLVVGQTNCSYITINNGGYSQTQIEQAFSNANLDSYRKRTVRRSMIFSNGAEVQLLSALEMTTNGCPVDPLKAMEDSAPLDPNRRFEIHASGVIVESVSKIIKE